MLLGDFVFWLRVTIFVHRGRIHFHYLKKLSPRNKKGNEKEQKQNYRTELIHESICGLSAGFAQSKLILESGCDILLIFS
jgi:hypothetical protein